MIQQMTMWVLTPAVLLSAAVAQAQCCIPRGGCSDPCLTGNCGVAVSSTGMPGTVVMRGIATGASPTPAAQSLCGPVSSYKVVMRPQYVTETRAQCATEYRQEKRYRTSTVYNTVPVVEERFRVKTISVPKTETKTVEYTELVAEKNERTVETTVSVPQWNEITETYLVKVPTLVDVPETYTVQVPELRDETFTYTVNVPYTYTETKLKTVNNAVPVTKSRVVKVCVPTTKTQTVTKDYGHWETRVEEVYVGSHYGGYGSASCGGGATQCGSSHCCGASHRCGSGHRCGSYARYAGCGSSHAGCGVAQQAAAQTVTRRVWVPNVRTETVTVPSSETHEHIVNYTVFEQQVEQVPYECTYVAYRPETRTGTKKVVQYVPEERTRMRKAVQYSEEPRTRTRRELSYRQETKTETYPYVSYRTETRTKEIRYTVNEPQSVVEPYTTTRYDRVPEERVETYIVRVPVSVMKEVQVQVCRMLPQLVPETIYPCQSGWSNVGPASVHSSGTSILLDGNAGCQGCGGCSDCTPTSPRAAVQHPAPQQPVVPVPQESVHEGEAAAPIPPAPVEAEEIPAAPPIEA